MATKYGDYVNGNDSNDGSSFANRVKTWAAGFTAARIAPGDVCRMMQSPDPTLLDNTGAVWTANSKTLTLSAAVTANISTCETAWTASANVTATADTVLWKEGTKSSKLVIASGFTTGLVAYVALGSSVDFSAYKQISFWIYNTAAVAASTLSLKLCSDTAGVTAVDTVAVPAIISTARWVRVTIDTGSALGSAIQSVALYADLDPGTVTIQLDNILACKDSTSADSLSLTSIVGKIHNLYWTASTSYAQNEIRKPTPPNRTGYGYKVQNSGGGTTGGTEPVWPLERGATVVDGGVTWVCETIEETWYPIQSINGTTVKLDNGTNTRGDAGRGYPGATETVKTYKRETIKMTMVSSSTVVNSVQDSGTVGNMIKFTGGWNTTDMTTQTGETWVDCQNGIGVAYGTNAKTFIQFENLSVVNSDFGVVLDANQTHARNCHAVGTTNTGLYPTVSGNQVNSFVACNANQCSGSNSMTSNSTGPMLIDRVDSSGGLSNGYGISGLAPECREIFARNNGSVGLAMSGHGELKVYGFVGSNNTFSDLNVQHGSIRAYNAVCPTGNSAGATNRDAWVWVSNFGGTVGDHRGTTDGGVVVSDTTRRDGGSGISWKFSCTATNRNSAYPLKMCLARIQVAANALVTISVKSSRDNSNIQGLLVVPGQRIAGVPTDLTTSLAPSVDTSMHASSDITFTPTADGVIEVWAHVWDGTGTTNSMWIDTVSASQA